MCPPPPPSGGACAQPDAAASQKPAYLHIHQPAHQPAAPAPAPALPASLAASPPSAEVAEELEVGQQVRMLMPDNGGEPASLFAAVPDDKLAKLLYNTPSVVPASFR